MTSKKPFFKCRGGEKCAGLDVVMQHVAAGGLSPLLQCLSVRVTVTRRLQRPPAPRKRLEAKRGAPVSSRDDVGGARGLQLWEEKTQKQKT